MCLESTAAAFFCCRQSGESPLPRAATGPASRTASRYCGGGPGGWRSHAVPLGPESSGCCPFVASLCFYLPSSKLTCSTVFCFHVQKILVMHFGNYKPKTSPYFPAESKGCPSWPVCVCPGAARTEPRRRGCFSHGHRRGPEVVLLAPTGAAPLRSLSSAGSWPDSPSRPVPSPASGSVCTCRLFMRTRVLD